MTDVIKPAVSGEPWMNGSRPLGAVSGRANSKAWADTARRRRRHHRLELMAAGLGGALVALLLVYLERRLFGG